ncbi:MAG: hypothetical protein IJ383_09515 [Bacteroidales bacterium]|nr:hypothetical protein [Bacteroidales bacterium]MBQ8224906.1 hypothetical protein [Bacteroides sp.]
MKNICYIILIASLLTACSQAEMEEPDRRIALSASVGELAVTTRAATAAPYKGTTPSSDNKFTADVWFSATSGEYSPTVADEEANLPCHTKIEFDSEALEYPRNENKDLKYPSGGSAYCVGLYPSGNTWTTTDNQTVSATIDGVQDLMFAPQHSGSWTSPFSQTPLQFNHLLTWLRICVCATSEDAPATWGEITRISVGSKDQVAVKLGLGTVTYGGNDVDIVALESTDGLPLATTIQEVGSVLCSPATEYTLKIKTSKGEDKEVLIKLNDLEGNEITDANSTVGKLFVLSLYFNKSAVLEGVCTLNSWNNQDEDLYLGDS